MNPCLDHLVSQPLWLLLVSILGFVSLLNYSLCLLNWVFITFLRKPKNLNQNYGSWALITGSTDGIGKAFAFQLAKQDLNLILVGRSPDKLQTVSNQIKDISPSTKIKTLTFDFSCQDLRDLVKSIESCIQGLDVGVLINNVGITYPEARFFDEVDEKTWKNIVRVNIEGTSSVTKAVLPVMLKRNKGAIVNIGSGASIVVPSHPLFTVYAATKAYIDQLSRCLHVEYRSRGIDVQCQVPLYVATNMTSRVAMVKAPSLFTPSAEDYAKWAVGRIGYEARCTPYWPHSLQWFFARLLPPALLDSWRLSIGTRRRQQMFLDNN